MRRMLKMFLHRMAFLKPMLETFLQIECRIASSWVASAHKRLMAVQWDFPPQPEHFDHHIDLFYHWLETRNSLWLERGVFGSLALRGATCLN
jgi:hypothetical protein